jgi:hypothetical protein
MRGPVVAIVLFAFCGLSYGNPSTTQPSVGPKVVVLQELEDLYQPVPFEHARHAEMAQMWGGCTTCHHHNPEPTTKPAVNGHPATQADSKDYPACKSCHPVAAEKVEINKPTLKGAYHRQCLNCHRDWAGENACGVCHAPKNGVKLKDPTPDDITGRMHPPIKAKDEIAFKVRFEPVAGANVLFRHKEHVERFDIKCVQCHRRDNCGDCHAKEAEKGAKVHPLKPGRTWQETHGPCIDCHKSDTCDKCHYKDEQKPPPSFKHEITGQSLDADHADLACRACHAEWKTRQNLSCGDTACHTAAPVEFPRHRPGGYIAVAKPTTAPSTQPATQPSTRPQILRIRRGGR